MASTAFFAPSAFAGSSKGTATGVESVSSGSWGASASPSSLSFAASGSQTSTLTDTGSVALAAVTYTVTISKPSTGTPTFTLYVCPVAWSSGKCQGGSGTQIGSTYQANAQAQATSVVVPGVGSSYYLQATGSSVKSTTTMTLSLAVSSPSQLRAAVSTNQ